MLFLSRVAVAAVLLSGACAVAAHVVLDSPLARPGALTTVGAPCGDPDPGRSIATSFAPGATIYVTWTETISHPGHFRISFDDDGQDDFVDPGSYTDFYTAPSVLYDNIANPIDVTAFAYRVTLPNIECDTCTLQLMQVLTDKPPYTSGSNSDDLHRICADLTLTLAAVPIFADGFED